MADSIEEQLLTNIKTALLTITTGNGFNNTVLEVLRTRTTPTNYSGLFPCIYMYSESDEVDDSFTIAETQNIMSLVLELWMQDDETGKDTQINNFKGDVIQKMMADEYFTNIADRSIRLSGEKMLEFDSTKGRGYIGERLRFNIVYRHKHNDPFNQV